MAPQNLRSQGELNVHILQNQRSGVIHPHLNELSSALFVNPLTCVTSLRICNDAWLWSYRPRSLRGQRSRKWSLSLRFSLQSSVCPHRLPRRMWCHLHPSRYGVSSKPTCPPCVLHLTNSVYLRYHSNVHPLWCPHWYIPWPTPLRVSLSRISTCPTCTPLSSPSVGTWERELPLNVSLMEEKRNVRMLCSDNYPKAAIPKLAIPMCDIFFPSFSWSSWSFWHLPWL